MKFTPRKLFLLIVALFTILFCWTVLLSRSSSSSSSSSSSLPEASSWKVSDKVFQAQFGSSEDKDYRDSKIVNNVESPVRDDEYNTNEQAVSQEKEPKPVKIKKPRKNRQKELDYVNIPCNINDELRIDCLKNTHNSSVYIPFSFIKKYFEITGKIVRNSNGQELFDWDHSYSKIFYPDQPYSYTDKYLWFENFNVELRERVLCTSAFNGVPISTQWFTKGHFYPTQIAQYGLSHFNKNITEPSPKRLLLYQNSKFTNKVKIFDPSRENSKDQFPDFSNDDDGDDKFQEDTKISRSTLERPLTLDLTKPAPNHLVADFELEPFGHYNMTFYFKDITEQTQPQYSLTYSTLIDIPFIKSSSSPTSDDSRSSSSISSLSVTNSVSSHSSLFGMSAAILNGSSSFRFTRDFVVDLIKSGLLTTARQRPNITLTRIVFSGKVQLQALTLLTSAHGRFAEIAGEWFVNNQNELGGWDVKVRRKLQKKKSNILILEPGWHSAMAQGQAISLLIRLYHSTKDQRYIQSAKKALKLFQMESIERGVRARLFDKFVWYEEYPTVPSIFVLNGFIYSLFGLYDLSKACEQPECKLAETLFMDGIHSLEEVLLLFDSGSGSFYDLRHLALGGPPNVARWDYHSTHINQLLQLNTIVKRDLFENTVERWTQYMKGHRAAHN